MPSRTGARRRLGSIRLSLILLALIPSVTLAAMWSVTTIQMFSEGLRLREQTELSKTTGAMGTDATLALQRERRLSAAWLANPHGDRTALDEQRRETDAAIGKLVRQSDAIDSAPSRISDRLNSVLGAVASLEYYRDQVDKPVDITPQQTLDQFTSIIETQITAFHELSQVDDGDLTSQADPLVSLERAGEMVAQEDALLTLAWPSGHLDDETRLRFSELVSARRWLVEDQIVPSLDGGLKTQTEQILQGQGWQALESMEDRLLKARPAGSTDNRRTVLPAGVEKRWTGGYDALAGEYTKLIQQQTRALLDRSGNEADALLFKAAVLSAAGFIALLVCAVMSWRITRSLSRRLRGLRMATLSLAEERLPDVVAALDRGEKVDVESATPPLDYGRDELGQVAQAFNAAQRTAVHTAVELADTRRGFQKVILGIARQSQNLVNLQLSKLDKLEREHQDPNILQGLYELDSTASQLRRYEENLVIISGERPGRTWTRPVALIDILRSAVGEVAQYQRVEVHTEEEVSVAPPAVADVIHLLAELIDNATAYSPAPSPVSVRAGMVARGLAVEVEDRGLGMSEEDYAAFNAQLAMEPQFDVVALADDLRLGMFVIARLATRHGIAVTLRSSPYGGTTAIVLIPHDIVVSESADAPVKGLDDTADTAATDAAGENDRPTGPVKALAHEAVADERPSAEGPDDGVRSHERAREPLPAQAPARTNGATPAAATARPAPRTPTAGRAAGRRPGLTPLPRRVPQTSLAAELREDTSPVQDGDPFDFDDFTAERAASSLAGFQRGTLQARDDGAESADQTEETQPEDADEKVSASGTPVTAAPPADR
ncbi:sensor histidine kinase [Streptomyces acidicola]|uniref:histidine kinase n=1 Tax=Streptomyces acidicola TaxID=2596892 RepID=A0A5N8WRP9_9ACTN|nr:nitrate- and nitrite sensing domain-containing protein [Streptomyces acidicola]MPY49238.1 sensor histidine kinase [Streptomyces acidicola]